MQCAKITGKIHWLKFTAWYRHAMRQIENFDFDPQNKTRLPTGQ